jgi:hypothetical protein
MKRKLGIYIVAGAFAALGAISTFTPVLRAQTLPPHCYPSYMTLSGTCPDSCGRGPDCPCTTCVPVNQT